MGFDTILQWNSNDATLSILIEVVSIKSTKNIIIFDKLISTYLQISVKSISLEYKLFNISVNWSLWVNYLHVLTFNMFSSFKPFQGLRGDT